VHGERPAPVDHNLNAAYQHVLAHALTSMLAVGALGGGILFGWRMLDPLMGLAGAAVAGRWVSPGPGGVAARVRKTLAGLESASGLSRGASHASRAVLSIHLSNGARAASRVPIHSWLTVMNWHP